MLEILDEQVLVNGHYFDYELEDGTLLHSSEWNGGVYTVKNKDGSETRYFPVYNQIDDEYEIIGFEVR